MSELYKQPKLCIHGLPHECPYCKDKTIADITRQLADMKAERDAARLNEARYFLMRTAALSEDMDVINMLSEINPDPINTEEFDAAIDTAIAARRETK